MLAQGGGGRWLRRDGEGAEEVEEAAAAAERRLGEEARVLRCGGEEVRAADSGLRN